MSATLDQSIIENERAKNRLFLLRLMGALLVLQLPAGAGDIEAARRAKRCLDMMFLERIEPVFDRLLGCCREIAALDIVHRKEIHVAKQASAIFDEGVEFATDYDAAHKAGMDTTVEKFAADNNLKLWEAK